jgi:hypothetical protein
MKQYRILKGNEYNGMQSCIGKTVSGGLYTNTMVAILGSELIRVGAHPDKYISKDQYGFEINDEVEEVI